MADSEGWLSTRNKRKITVTTPKTSSKRRRKSVVAQHPLGVATPLVCGMLTQNSPPPAELFTHTKQTNIASFFKAKENPTGKENIVPCRDQQTDSLLGINHSVKLPTPKKQLNENNFWESSVCEEFSGNGLNTQTHLTERNHLNTQTHLTEGNHLNTQPHHKEGNHNMCNNSEKDNTDNQMAKKDDYLNIEGNKESTKSFIRIHYPVTKKSDSNKTVIQDEDGSKLDSQLEFSTQVSTSQSNKQSELSHSRLDSDEKMSDFSTDTCIYSEDFNDDSLSSVETIPEKQSTPNVAYSEEPFTFAFLTQDLGLRTRGITPLGPMELAKGNNSDTLDTSTFTNTLSTLDSNILDTQITDYSLGSE